MISTTTVRVSPACPRRSPTSRPLAPISPTTLWCPEVRLGMCNPSMLMGCTSMVLDPPLVSTSSSTPTAGVFLARRFLAPPTSRSRKAAAPSPSTGPDRRHVLGRDPGQYDFQSERRVGLDRPHCAVEQSRGLAEPGRRFWYVPH